MTGPVASIGVAVVPDATDFWRKFEAKTLGQAAKTGESEGKAFMRGFQAAADSNAANLKVKLTTKQALEELEKLKLEIKALGDTKIRIGSDIDHLGRAFANTSRDANRARGDIDRMGSSFARSGRTAESSGRRYESFYRRILRWVALLGPGLVPIGAVAVGALAELGPIAATAALGLTKLKKEYDAGALKGTKLGNSVNAIKREYSQLQTISARPLGHGIELALTAITPMLPTLNKQFAGFGVQVGQIVAHVGPGLVALFEKLNPMFVELGNGLVRGAAGFERWAKSPDSMVKFMTYVHDNLGDVVNTLSNFGQAIGHFLAAIAPYGSVVLEVIDGLSNAINAIPTGVLGPIASTVLKIYAAFRLWKIATGIVNGVSLAAKKMGASFTAAGNTIGAAYTNVTLRSGQASLTAVANAETQAGLVAIARADEAEVTLASESAQLTAMENIGAADTAMQEIITNNALAISVARDEEAASAVAAAELSAAAAERSAEQIAASGVIARAGWAGVLGPLAAVAFGIALLIPLFHKHSSAAGDAAKAMDAYSQSMEQSTNAMSVANVQATQKQLLDGKAVDTLNQLHQGNVLTATSTNDLIDAVNLGGDAYKNLTSQLDAVIAKGAELQRQQVESTATGGSGAVGPVADDSQILANAAAAKKLKGEIDTLRGSFSAQQKQQLLAIQVQRDYETAEDGGSTAVANQARALGLTVPAYLDASKAAKDAADSQATQTAQMQAASDAAGLLQAALDGLAGVQLSLSAAQDQFRKGLNDTVKGMLKGKDSIKGFTAQALDNRSAIRGNVTDAQQVAIAVGKATHSTDAATKSYRDQIKAIKDTFRAHHELTPAISNYIDKMADVKDVQDFINKHPAEFNVKTDPAIHKLDQMQAAIKNIRQGKVPGISVNTAKGHTLIGQLQSELNALRQNKVPGVDAHTSAAQAKIGEIQQMINGLRDRTVTINTDIITNRRSGSNIGARLKAAGGYISGPGSGTSDSIPAWLSNGEYVVNAKATAANLALLHSINAQHYASGGQVKKPKDFVFNGIHYSSQRAAQNARTRASQSSVKKSRSDALSSVGSALGSVGTPVTLAFDISQTSLAFVVGQITKVRNQVQSLFSRGIITKTDEANFNTRIKAMTSLAQREARALAGKVTSDAKGFLSSLAGTASDVQDSFATMFGDAAKLNPSTKQRNLWISQEKTLVGLVNQRAKQTDELTTAQDHYNDVYQTYTSEVASVHDALLANFDITSAGTSAFEGQVASIGSITAQQKQAVAAAQQFQAGMATLGKLGLDPQMLAQFAQAGTSALPQITALAGATSAQIATLNQQYKTIGTVGTAVGSQVGGALYGKQVDTARALIYGAKAGDRATTADVATLAKQLYGKAAPSGKALNEGLKDYRDTTSASITTLGNKIKTEMTSAVTAISRKPVVLVADGRQLAKVVEQGQKRNKRRS